jgi:hypothetical protein
MMRTNVTGKPQAAYEQAFYVLKAYPLHRKNFISMQHLTDINYSPVINFDENDFIVAGPGALDGIQKCFGILGPGWTPEDAIRECVKDQAAVFEFYGEQPVLLGGKRSLTLIDMQNCFCEIDKYARVAHPTVTSPSGRTTIKQTFKTTGPQPAPFFPPKWEI